MEPTEHRSSIAQLANDLNWLEDHCRKQPELATQAGTLRLASALTRNCIGPFLEGQPARPLHLVVVGGAGAGKSTVVNLLAGAVVAETNPQAGYTRHPTAFLPGEASYSLPSTIGFMGPLQRASGDKPANVDEDLYQVKRLPVASPNSPSDPHPLADYVIWDCPDMTTWAASGYVNRLMEVTALADAIVYVASDERYNDEVPTQFLHLIIKAGKAVVVALTKMREQDAPSLIEHFRREILGRLPRLPDGSSPAVPVIAIPQLTPAERNDPAGSAIRHRVALLNQIFMLGDSSRDIRLRTIRNATRYLATAGQGLLDVARRDLAEFDAWKTTVTAGKLEFENRYRREFLTGEQFHRMDRYRDEILDLLELPGAGRLLSSAIWLARTPYRWTRDYIAGLIIRPETFNLSEQTVLTAALSGWLDKLHTEALKRASGHTIWKQIALRFDAELAPQAREHFGQECRNFELKETDDLERVGKSMVDRLENNPTLLYTVRGCRLLVDLAIVAGILYVTWPPYWYLILLLPLGVSVSHQATELLVRGVVEGARRRVRNQREALVTTDLTQPLAHWLCEWPATGGSSIEKLQQVLHRVPETIRQLEQRVTAKADEWKTSNPAVSPQAPPPMEQA